MFKKWLFELVGINRWDKCYLNKETMRLVYKLRRGFKPIRKVNF